MWNRPRSVASSIFAARAWGQREALGTHVLDNHARDRINKCVRWRALLDKAVEARLDNRVVHITQDFLAGIMIARAADVVHERQVVPQGGLLHRLTPRATPSKGDIRRISRKKSKRG